MAKSLFLDEGKDENAAAVSAVVHTYTQVDGSDE